MKRILLALAILAGGTIGLENTASAQGFGFYVGPNYGYRNYYYGPGYYYAPRNYGYYPRYYGGYRGGYYNRGYYGGRGYRRW